jgi:hypothetical protein
VQKNFYFSLITIHIVGLITYFFVFGTLNVYNGKIGYSDVNILSVIYICVLILTLTLVNISYYRENNSSIFLSEIKKFSNFNYLILCAIVFIIIAYFYLNIDNIFAYTKLNLAENKNILKFAKIKNFIIIPLLFLLFFISILKIFNQKNILLNLIFIIACLFFISFFGRRILGSLLILSLIILYSQLIKKEFSNISFKKIIILSFAASFIWISFSNYYLNFRKHNSNNPTINSLFDYDKTIKNFGSRPSPFFHLNQIVNNNDKGLLFQSNGFLIIQSIENSIPKKILSNKRFISEDLLISNYALNTGQLDLSSNSLSLFIVEFSNIGVAVYLMFIISIILTYNVLLNLLRSNRILFLSFYSLAAITMFQIEIVTSTYFNVIIIGVMLVIFNFLLDLLKLNKFFLLEIK